MPLSGKKSGNGWLHFCFAYVYTFCLSDLVRMISVEQSRARFIFLGSAVDIETCHYHAKNLEMDGYISALLTFTRFACLISCA